MVLMLPKIYHRFLRFLQTEGGSLAPRHTRPVLSTAIKSPRHHWKKKHDPLFAIWHCATFDKPQSRTGRTKPPRTVPTTFCTHTILFFFYGLLLSFLTAFQMRLYNIFFLFSCVFVTDAVTIQISKIAEKKSFLFFFFLWRFLRQTNSISVKDDFVVAWWSWIKH